MGIPAVMGAQDLPVGRIDGEEVVVDGYQGRVYIRPSASVIKEFKRLANEEAELSEGLSELRNLPAETVDGRRIPLLANTGLASDLLPSLQSGAEGIGLRPSSTSACSPRSRRARSRCAPSTSAATSRSATSRSRRRTRSWAGAASA
jgi:hypothetical protein